MLLGLGWVYSHVIQVEPMPPFFVTQRAYLMKFSPGPKLVHEETWVFKPEKEKKKSLFKFLYPLSIS